MLCSSWFLCYAGRIPDYIVFRMFISNLEPWSAIWIRLVTIVIFCYPICQSKDVARRPMLVIFVYFYAYYCLSLSIFSLLLYPYVISCHVTFFWWHIPFLYSGYHTVWLHVSPPDALEEEQWYARCALISSHPWCPKLHANLEPLCSRTTQPELLC